MTQTNDSAQVLQQLVQTTDQAVATLEARAAAGTNLEMQFADIQKKFDEAAKIADRNERDMRMRVLSANLEELRKDAGKEEQDLAQAVFGLNALLESMGHEYSELSSLSPAEQKIVADAEKRLTLAQGNRARAETKWFFRQAAIQNADTELVNAKAGIDEAKAEAKRLARKRLLEADMASSLQEFMLRVEKTIQIMQHRMGELEAQVKMVSARKQKAFEIKEQAAKALEQLDQELNGKEADLKREEELLLTIEAGTNEHAHQSKVVSDLRATVEDLRGRRNTAFVLHQSKDKFAAELEIHERTQMKLRDNQRMWITSLRSDTEERVVTFRSRLEAMKAASDQDVAKNLDALGAEADRRNADYMASVGAASDRLRMDKIESHPKRVAEIAKIAAAQAEAIQQIRVREQAAIEHFKKLYGIDPTQSSFFHYQEGAESDKDTETHF
ncbi:MAG: hypothetical protein U0136_10390 [Bdellovibrionota bacterium]